MGLLVCMWGGLARGRGFGLFAFGGAYWPLAIAHFDPLLVPMCFNGALEEVDPGSRGLLVGACVHGGGGFGHLLLLPHISQCVRGLVSRCLMA